MVHERALTDLARRLPVVLLAFVPRDPDAAGCLIEIDRP
jgi:hypothetical protein